jgi:methyl-accepting chemotaxis protein
MKSFLKEIKDKFEEIEEANVTGNLDGGAGPPRTPKAFSKSKDEDNLDNDHIEVLGYKKAKKTNKHFKAMESFERKLEKKINEISYKEYKSDDSRKDYQKVNDSIKKINRMMFEVEQIVNQNAKLKNEAGVHTGQYWKSTQNRFGKISERMLKVARTLKELSL